MAKKKGLHFTMGVKEKAKKVPNNGFLAMIPKRGKKGAGWSPKVSV
jgi:hypothetical protein